MGATTNLSCPKNFPSVTLTVYQFCMHEETVILLFVTKQMQSTKQNIFLHIYDNLIT